MNMNKTIVLTFFIISIFIAAVGEPFASELSMPIVMPPIHHVPFVATTTPQPITKPPEPPSPHPSPSVSVRDILWNDNIDVYSTGAPGDSITFIGSLSNLAAMPPINDQYSDGVWLSNGKYSANLYIASTSFILNGGDNDFMYAKIPKMVCPGAESATCSPNLMIPTPFGNYSIYIKLANGTFKSDIYQFTVVPVVSPPPRGREDYR